MTMVLTWLLTKAGLDSPLSNRLLALGVGVGVLALSVYNAYTPVVRHQQITIDKPLPAPVRIAVASDLHLGAWVGKRELGKLSEILKQEQVDVLLIPGDVLDDDTVAFDRLGMASAFKQMAGSVPVAAATLGNHDLYRTEHHRAINRAITDAGIILLKDEVDTVSIHKGGQDIALHIIGRYDDHYDKRVPTASLMQGLDDGAPVLLLDHRPTDIETHSTLPIDLQVSGHTHKGQVFPANFIVQAINRVGYGYERINDTHFVVSSGLGFWGVPFRLGSQSEVWVIEMVGR